MAGKIGAISGKGRQLNPRVLCVLCWTSSSGATLGYLNVIKKVMHMRYVFINIYLTCKMTAGYIRQIRPGAILQLKAGSGHWLNPEELRVDCWTYLNTAVGNTNSVPSFPEQCVFASVGKTDVSYSWSVVLEYMGHLKNTHQYVSVVIGLFYPL